MVLVTSVFLTQLLCLLVPCDPQYQLPDTNPEIKKKEGNDPVTYADKLHLNEIEYEGDRNSLLQKPFHQSFISAKQLHSKASNTFKLADDCVDEQLFVQTHSGGVMGYRIQVVGGRKICAFEGIPYAEAPIGELRFRNPVPKQPWGGVFRALQYGPECMQYNPPQALRTIGKEDCLFLNVYGVPSPHKLLPVIVFVHGGGFFFGSSTTYGPTYLLQNDIILVTVQYRLGVLGFFSTGDVVCPGNFGLKDQTLALKWVHENIEFFGGDKRQVTLMGQSAGSASVHLHMVSQSSRQYFQRAISLSGTAFNYWSHYDLKQTRNLTNAFATELGCPTENSEQLVECFRALNPVDLVSLTPQFLDDWPFPQNAFRPSIEVIECSASVHLHMVSQSSRQYFQRAISLSGTAFNYWSHYDLKQTRNLTNAFATELGCPTENSEQLVECFRALNPVDLVSLTPQFLDDWPFPQNAFRPSIEVIEGNPDPFLTDFPENIYARNEAANVPWIVTTVSGEGYAFLMFPFITKQIPILRRNWYDLALDLIDADNLEVDESRILKRLNKFYFKNVPPEKASVHTFAQIVTDRSFLTGIYEAAKAHVQIAPTYSYLFDFNGQYNMIVNYGYPSSEWGVGHIEDLFYLFNSTRIYNGFQRGELEYDISNILVNLITNFATKGKPLYTTDTGEDIEIWQPHQSPNNLNFLGISKYVGMVGDPFKKRIKFWRNMRLPDTPYDVIVAG